MSLQADRKEYITQEDGGKKEKVIYIDIYKNLKDPYINSLI